MKIVAVDVGNTSTAAGIWENGKVGHVAHCDGGFGEAKAAVSALVRKFRPVAMAYLSVVPKADSKWAAFARAEKLQFVRITHEHATLCPNGPLRLDYPRPETIGADRLADAAAAVDRYGAPVIVCDFGTAFTAAVVTADRTWRGGVIAPGFPLMRDYLFERTAKLPRMEIGGRIPKIGRSTVDAMRFGAQVGYRGMVKEIVKVLSDNFKTDFRLVATGGFARWALRGSGLDFTIDPTLTLHGAGLMANTALETQGGQKGIRK